MYSHGHSVGDAKGRILQLRMDAESSSSPDAPSCFLPVDVREDVASPQPDLLTGVSLTLPDGTTVSIRRGSAEAGVRLTLSSFVPPPGTFCPTPWDVLSHPLGQILSFSNHKCCLTSVWCNHT
jgi:hypothetical protein